MNSDQIWQRAEQSFRQEESARGGRRALPEYEARALAIREKTERLRTLRLAKEAQARTEGPTPKQQELRPTRIHK